MNSTLETVAFFQYKKPVGIRALRGTNSPKGIFQWLKHLPDGNFESRDYSLRVKVQTTASKKSKIDQNVDRHPRCTKLEVPKIELAICKILHI